jgi:DNA replication protein DnaC
MSPTPAQAEEAQRLIAQKLASRPELRIVKKEPEPWVPDCVKCNDVVVVRPGPYCECPAGAESQRLWDAMKASEEAARQRRLEKVREKLQRAGGFVVPKRYERYTTAKRYERYTTATLRNLVGKADYDRDKKPAVDLLAAWADRRLQKPSLLLTGEPGVGKTALALGAVRARTRATGESKLLIRYIRFIHAIQGTYDGNGDVSKEELLLAASTVDVLMLDDFGENALGLKAASNDKQNSVREVLDYRNMHDLATLIITNLTEGRLQAQFGDDIISRLQEMAILVEVGGEDLRQRGAVGWQRQLAR